MGFFHFSWHNYGKSPWKMVISIISMAIFHSYFDITRGYILHGTFPLCSTRIVILIAYEKARQVSTKRGSWRNIYMRKNWVGTCGNSIEKLGLFEQRALQDLMVHHGTPIATWLLHVHNVGIAMSFAPSPIHHHKRVVWTIKNGWFMTLLYSHSTIVR